MEHGLVLYVRRNVQLLNKSIFYDINWLDVHIKKLNYFKKDKHPQTYGNLTVFRKDPNLNAI